MNLSQISTEYRQARPEITQATANLDTLQAYRKAGRRFASQRHAAALALMMATAPAPLAVGLPGIPIMLGGYAGGMYAMHVTKANLEKDADQQIVGYNFNPDAPSSELSNRTRDLLKQEHGLT